MDFGCIEPVVYVFTRPNLHFTVIHNLTGSLWFSGTFFAYFIIVVYMKLWNPYNQLLSSFYKDPGRANPKTTQMVFVHSPRTMQH
jgi:hypothetical protein